MSTPNTAIRYSYDDYKCLSNATDKRYELLDGDLLMVPSPTTSHQQVAGNLFLHLAQFVGLNKLGKVFYGPMDVVFGEGARREVARSPIFFL